MRHVKRRESLVTAAADHSWIPLQSAFTARERSDGVCYLHTCILYFYCVRVLRPASMHKNHLYLQNVFLFLYLLI